MKDLEDLVRPDLPVAIQICLQRGTVEYRLMWNNGHEQEVRASTLEECSIQAKKKGVAVNDIVEHIQALCRVTFPKSTKAAVGIWWPEVIKRAGVLPTSELGEDLTGQDLAKIWSYVIDCEAARMAKFVTSLEEERKVKIELD